MREHDAQLQVRVVDKERIGVASTNRLDEAGIRGVVERAAAIAERSAPNPRAAILPEPDGRGHDPELGLVAATAEAGAERRAEGARAVIAAGQGAGLETAGSFSTTVMTIAVANSKGIRASHRSTRASLLTVMMDGFASGAASGYAHAGAADIGDIDAEAIGAEAAEKGDRMRGAEALEAGEYEVILEEYAVAGLLEYLSYIGFSGMALEEGRSFMELGKRVMGENVSIWDDGADATGLPAPIDFEGVVRKRVDLITDGVANAVVHDAATGARAGTGSTGHGLPAPNLMGPMALNTFMAPGTTPRDELIGGIERGRVGDALPLHQPGPPEEGDPHRHDEGRHVPDRGWQADPAGAELPLHAGDSRGLQRRPRREPRDEVAARRVLRRLARAGAAPRLVQLHRHDRLGGRRVTMAAPLELRIGDRLRLRKEHPCGSRDWEVVRLGADIGLVCDGCGHRILMDRLDVERRFTEYLARGSEEHT